MSIVAPERRYGRICLLQYHQLTTESSIQIELDLTFFIIMCVRSSSWMLRPSFQQECIRNSCLEMARTSICLEVIRKQFRAISIKAQDIVSENAGKQWRVMARISQLKYETHRLTDA